VSFFVDVLRIFAAAARASSSISTTVVPYIQLTAQYVCVDQAGHTAVRYSQLRSQNRMIAFGGQRTIDASDCCRVPLARQLILSSERNYTMKV
jgi:hypothetical protein